MRVRFPPSTAIAIAALLLPRCLPAVESIDSSNITQVVKDVSVIVAATKARRPARVNDAFSVPDIMKTGADSRAEMIAPDQTVTRVGANTIFSFEPEKREINLRKGSILFNSATGKGGGTIKTAAATASVLGTTLIVVTTDNGGFKVLLLEGTGRVRTPKGRFRTLKAGQMVFALPGGDLSQVLTYQLSRQIEASLLVSGFKKPLPSIAKIESAIARQEAMIAGGQLQQTGLLAGNEADKAFRVDVNSRDVLIRKRRTGSGGETSGGTDPVVAAPLTNAFITRPRLNALGISDFDPASFPVNFDFFGGGAGSRDNVSVFAARNTAVLTPAIDLSPFPGPFLFFSEADFLVGQSVTIRDSSGPVTIFAGGTIRQAPGAVIRIESSSARVITLGMDPAAMTASDPLVLSGGGIAGSESLFVSAPSISLDSAFLSAFGKAQGFTVPIPPGSTINMAAIENSAFRLSATRDLRVNVLQNFTADRSLLSAVGSVFLDAGNDIRETASVTAGNPQVSYTAGNNISLRNVAFIGRADAPGSLVQSVSLTAGNVLSLNTVSVRAQSVSLEARTVALKNVNFRAGSAVTLRSETGLLAARPNTNRPVELGKVNFIQNVNYGGLPAQRAVRTGDIIIGK